MNSQPGYYTWPLTAHTQTSATTFFQQNGYVVLTSFATPVETTSLRTAAGTILADFYTTYNTSTTHSKFTTDESRRESTDLDFIRSASKIHCFLEDTCQSINTLPKVNKIGHALHDLHPIFEQFSYQQKVRQAVSLVIDFNLPLWMVQSMYILKSAKVGGEVRAHRDATFVRAKGDDSKKCIGLWWALEDADIQNGCLWVVPKSHVDKENIRLFDGWENGETELKGDDDCKGYDEKMYVPLVMKEGDLVILHGAVVHKSERNKSERDRHAYSVHVVQEGVEKACWLKRDKQLPFRKL